MLEISKKSSFGKMLLWVALARSKDKTKKVLSFMQVKGGYILAADGYRAHRVINSENIPDGIYEVLVSGGCILPLPVDESDFKYPDTDRILEIPENAKTCDISSCVSLAMCEIYAEFGLISQYEILKDAMMCPDGFDSAQSLGGTSSPIFLASKTALAVFTPIRKPKNQ